MQKPKQPQDSQSVTSAVSELTFANTVADQTDGNNEKSQSQKSKSNENTDDNRPGRPPRVNSRLHLVTLPKKRFGTVANVLDDASHYSGLTILQPSVTAKNRLKRTPSINQTPTAPSVITTRHYPKSSSSMRGSQNRGTNVETKQSKTTEAKESKNVETKKSKTTNVETKQSKTTEVKETKNVETKTSKTVETKKTGTLTSLKGALKRLRSGATPEDKTTANMDDQAETEITPEPETREIELSPNIRNENLQAPERREQLGESKQSQNIEEIAIGDQNNETDRVEKSDKQENQEEHDKSTKSLQKPIDISREKSQGSTKKTSERNRSRHGNGRSTKTKQKSRTRKRGNKISSHSTRSGRRSNPKPVDRPSVPQRPPPMFHLDSSSFDSSASNAILDYYHHYNGYYSEEVPGPSFESRSFSDSSSSDCTSLSEYSHDLQKSFSESTHGQQGARIKPGNSKEYDMVDRDDEDIKVPDERRDEQLIMKRQSSQGHKQLKNDEKDEENATKREIHHLGKKQSGLNSVASSSGKSMTDQNSKESGAVLSNTVNKATQRETSSVSSSQRKRSSNRSCSSRQSGTAIHRQEDEASSLHPSKETKPSAATYFYLAASIALSDVGEFFMHPCGSSKSNNDKRPEEEKKRGDEEELEHEEGDHDQ